MSDKSEACPKCGTPVVIEPEMTDEERKALALQEAEKKARMKKLIMLGSIAVVAVIAIIVIIASISKSTSIKKSTSEIILGDDCVAAYRFDEADAHYSAALNYNHSVETQRLVAEKRHAIELAKQKAEEEYNTNLQRLKILLEADDYEFNEFSNQCLDEMLKIYPDKKESIYYNNMRKK